MQRTGTGHQGCLRRAAAPKMAPGSILEHWAGLTEVVRRKSRATPSLFHVSYRGVAHPPATENASPGSFRKGASSANAGTLATSRRWYESPIRATESASVLWYW